MKGKTMKESIAELVWKSDDGRLIVEDFGDSNYLLSEVMAGSPNRPIARVEFQSGLVKNEGHNGWTGEALLGLLIHRTETVNKRFPCPENVAAIQDMKDAMYQFDERVRNRALRGVNDSHKV